MTKRREGTNMLSRNLSSCILVDSVLISLRRHSVDEMLMGYNLSTRFQHSCVSG